MKITFPVAAAFAAILCVLAGVAVQFLDPSMLLAGVTSALPGLMLANGPIAGDLRGLIEGIGSKVDEIKQKQSTDIADLRREVDRIEGKSNLQGLFGSGGAGGTRGESLGDLAVKEFAENRALLEKTRTLRVELKAAGDAVTTISGRMTMSGGVGAIQGGVLGLQNGLPQRVVQGVTALDYARYTGQQGAAAQQATEGTAKAQVRPDHTIITQSALTIAGFTKMSRQALSDASELRAAVDVTLRRSVMTALDTALMTGATGFTGGFNGLATAYTSLLYTALVDAISEGFSAMQTAGFSPNVVALNPADWLAITVAKGTDLHYLSGAYLGAMPMEMRGLRVVLSPNVTAGKALLLDMAHAEMLLVGGVVLEAGYDADDFTKNLMTVLCEVRVIPVFRTVGAARLITPKP